MNNKHRLPNSHFFFECFSLAASGSGVQIQAVLPINCCFSLKWFIIAASALLTLDWFYPLDWIPPLHKPHPHTHTPIHPHTLLVSYLSFPSFSSHLTVISAPAASRISLVDVAQLYYFSEISECSLDRGCYRLKLNQGPSRRTEDKRQMKRSWSVWKYLVTLWGLQPE